MANVEEHNFAAYAWAVSSHARAQMYHINAQYSCLRPGYMDEDDRAPCLAIADRMADMILRRCNSRKTNDECKKVVNIVIKSTFPELVDHLKH